MNSKYVACFLLSTFFASVAAAAPDAVPSATGSVMVRMLVPERKAAKDNFIIYPYPVRPPTNDKELEPLPKTMKQFKMALLNSGYGGRTVASKAYPSQGWRWRYIVNTAIEKSKLPIPHNVLNAYTWVDEMVPYALPELKKVKAAERMRIVRYKKAKEFWDLYNVDLENLATQTGKHPREIAFDEHWVAHTKLPEGMWWVVGVHKVPSLVFYWQEPIKVVAGKLSTVSLDEWNALVVQGDW
jgi:hypothetical protein